MYCICNALYCVVLCCVVLYCIALHCIVLYCIVLYCIVLYCMFSVEKPFGACDGSDNDLSWSITRNSRTGFISTGTILDTRCGREDSPIRISAWPGQRLNITVYDFSYAASSTPGSPVAPGNALTPMATGFGGSLMETECSHFVVFFDPEVRRQIKVCPGLRRVRNVYVTANRSIDVFFKRVGPDVFDQRFLIQYTGSISLFSLFVSLSVCVSVCRSLSLHIYIIIYLYI